MHTLARFVVARRWWVIGAWAVLAFAGGLAAPRATSALSYDFGLPGQKGYEANQDIVQEFGSGGDNAPVLLVLHSGGRRLDAQAAATVVRAVRARVAGRVSSYAQEPRLLSRDGDTGVVMVYPTPLPGQDPYARALPALKTAAQEASAAAGVSVTVTGQDALNDSGGGGGAGVLAETLFGGIGALVVLVLVFGSFLALMPLAVAIGSILTTFLIVWGLTAVTDVSFIVQYLLALIGLGVAIDYALLVVTRWREERGNGLDNAAAVERAVVTAGRSVLFSGVTVAVSLAALIALPVPFLRSVGFTGLLIPVVSVIAALTLLPALLLVAGPRLAWPNRRTASPDSRMWRWIGERVVRHRWAAIVASTVVLLALAAPVLGLSLGQPSNDSLASTGGSAAVAVHQVERAGLGAGLTTPVEVLTSDVARVRRAVAGIDGVSGVLAPPSWVRGDRSVVDVWTTGDASNGAGSTAAADVRRAVLGTGARVGGIPAQNADFITAVYGNAWWVVTIIVVVTFLLLARALRSLVLPLKALVLNVLSIAAAYGVTVLIWQHGVGTNLLFGQSAARSVTVWIPIAVFAFLFGLSMDYEVFLLSRIREERDRGLETGRATVDGVARTGRLITSAAVILFLAFVSLSRVPATDVKILATALALGILIDATLVRGILAPALVAALGPANWWLPRSRTTRKQPGHG
ncbi:MMPL family transporter [Streptomyces sp. NBC_01477]|uniref:MMPL family transporter n=1 Tax=Streptomyces sp. NBC_01477 TaxID=2976015 RepID=UPI002E328588|nr:MMPL family transporter [Streptomyces sp. NBC_01477]